MRSNQIGSMGVRLCSSCEHNLKCSECSVSYKCENLLQERDALLEQLETALKENSRLECLLKDRTSKVHELEEKLRNTEKKKEVWD